MELKQSLDKFRGVKFLQVIDPFSHADVSDRNLQLFRDSDYDPSLGCPIQFGEGDACHPNGLVEEFRLRDCILTGCGVKDEEDLMRRPGAFSPDNPFHLF